MSPALALRSKCRFSEHSGATTWRHSWGHGLMAGVESAPAAEPMSSGKSQCWTLELHGTSEIWRWPSKPKRINQHRKQGIWSLILCFRATGKMQPKKRNTVPGAYYWNLLQDYLDSRRHYLGDFHPSQFFKVIVYYSCCRNIDTVPPTSATLWEPFAAMHLCNLLTDSTKYVGVDDWGPNVSQNVTRLLY